MVTIRDLYEHRSPALQAARRKLSEVLAEVVANIEDKELVRATVSDVRIKSLAGIERKASAKGWKAEDALSMCGDLIGGRIICNNVEDVHRCVELLKERLAGEWSGLEIQDHIRTPKAGGYRAIHLNFRLDVADSPMSFDLVGCEVQVRSRLQDAWAELVHDDIYKHGDLPKNLSIQADHLSELLATADKIASGIRAQVSEATYAPKERPELDVYSSEGINFIFRDTFGRSLPDYALRQAENRCKTLGIGSLEKLNELTRNVDFRSRLAKAYRSAMPASMQIEDIFLACIYASAKGEARALAKVRRDARREWREIETVAKRDIVASLPDTFEELVEQIEDSQSEADIESWAMALDAASECAICRICVVRPAEFAEAVVDHYDILEDERDEARERLEVALSHSGIETGGWGSGIYCAYHNDRAAKD